jgi:hypothetical protein
MQSDADCRRVERGRGGLRRQLIPSFNPLRKPNSHQLKRIKIMSAKNVDSFFEKVAQDKTLQAKLKALHQKTLKETKESKDKASAAVAKIALAAGFKFTAKDLAGARGAKAKKPSKTELSEVSGQWMDCSGGTYNYCTAQNWSCIGSYY